MRLSAVKLLIGANVAVYGLQQLAPNRLENAFALWPLQPIDGVVQFHAWQIVSYAFLHSTDGISHLLFNMIGLWMFGTQVEERIGPARFLAVYFASVITAALSQLFIPALFGGDVGPTIGASGGVFGLLLAYAMLFPRRKVVPLIPPIPMPAWLFASIYAGLELLLGVTGAQASVAHFAHLGGMIGSAIVMLTWRDRSE
jgi:membrane associated rhomboid family serine protease